jgi:hypothetical protein
VSHNHCNWRSNKLRITFFSFLFFSLPIFYYYYFDVPPPEVMQGLVLIQTYTKNCDKNVTMNTSIKQRHSQGLMLGFACSVPDCWLEVSLHPEGPATGQLDQGFPWFSLVPEQMLNWYPNSRCSVCFTCNPPNGNFKVFRLMQPVNPTNANKNFNITG